MESVVYPEAIDAALSGVCNAGVQSLLDACPVGGSHQREPRDLVVARAASRELVTNLAGSGCGVPRGSCL
jgi:hypothetical protein